MIYIVIDAVLNSSGIRNMTEGGYLEPSELKLSKATISKINNWLFRYSMEHYNGFKNKELIEELDNEGLDIAKIIKNEIKDVKVSYFSSAKLKYIH